VKAVLYYHYNLSEIETNMIVWLFPILFLPSALVGTIIYNKWSLKTGLVIAAGLQCLGCSLKILIEYHYAFIYIGQIMVAIANPLIYIMPAALCTTWFEDKKRIIALTIATSCNTLGIAEGYGISRIFISADITYYEGIKSQLSRAFIYFSVLSAIIFLLVVFTFQSEPLKPPSPCSTVFRDDDILGTYWCLAHNKNFIYFTCSHVAYFVAIACFIVNIESITQWYDIGHQTGHQLILISAGGGFFGSFLLGMLLSKYKVYKASNVLIGVLGA
jgi:fucose permease